MIHRRWTARLPDGAAIRADVRIPVGPPPRSAVVVAHGFKGFKDWGFFPHVCEALVADGHGAVVFDFSLNGVVADGGELTDFDAFARNTLTRELHELRRVLAAVRAGEVFPAPVRSVGLLGHSRGGGVAIVAAGSGEEIGALVTWGAVAHFDRWSDETRAEWREAGRVHVVNTRTGRHMPLDVTLLEDFEKNRELLDVEAAAARVEAPWLIVHGEEDISVSSEDARRLARANPRARLDLVEGAGHTFEARHPFEAEPPELDDALRRTRAHFARHLAGPSAFVHS